jgi:2,3-bisphosphoglycerate-independent phosphoglycerate mutase
MVGHTGNVEATVKAIETVDECIGKIFKECKKSRYSLIITSDHGNAENMFDEKKKMVCTTHSLNLVPFTICEKINYSIKTGKLADIAPTVLKLLGLEIPDVMKGKPLIK